MKTEIKIFKNDQFGEVRVIEIDDELHFVAKDVAETLGYTWHPNLVSHVPDEWKGRNPITSPGGKQEVITLSEQGLYFFLARSDKPTALPFQKWIAGEILPSIRKHGGYLTPQKIEEILLNPDTLIRLATDLKNERQRRLEAENVIMEQAPKVEYCDNVLNSQSRLTVNMIASTLGISPVRLNKALCDWGVQYRQSGTYFLFQEYRDKGYARHEPIPYIDSRGEKQTRQHLYWTEEGKRFIVWVWQKMNNSSND